MDISVTGRHITAVTIKPKLSLTWPTSRKRFFFSIFVKYMYVPGRRPSRKVVYIS